MPSPLRIAGFIHAMVGHGLDGFAWAGVNPRERDRRVRTFAAGWPTGSGLRRTRA
jgi:hypothetical protein